jgi:hypothetical protein
VLPDGGSINPHASTEMRLIKAMVEEVDTASTTRNESISPSTFAHLYPRRNNMFSAARTHSPFHTQQLTERVQERLVDLALEWW